jgi:adenylate cyclase
LHFGVGILTGDSVADNVGSDLRKDYSAIGDAVSLAKRLQEVAKPDEIIVNQVIYDMAKNWIELRKWNQSRSKGVKPGNKSTY